MVGVGRWWLQVNPKRRNLATVGGNAVRDSEREVAGTARLSRGERPSSSVGRYAHAWGSPARAAAAAAAARRIRRNEIIRRGDSPAASTRVVEGLPLITVSEEGLGDGDGVCAVCKDKFVQGEKLRVLPCVHRYHQDCILPWLSMRNTCPVCRFELPRDDSRPGIQRTVRDGAMSGGGLHSDTPI